MSPGDCPVVSMPYAASFPISGRVVRPNADDYEAEVVLLRQEARVAYRAKQRDWGRWYRLATVYARLGRRKRHAEDLAAMRAPRTAGEVATDAA